MSEEHHLRPLELPAPGAEAFRWASGWSARELSSSSAHPRHWGLMEEQVAPGAAGPRCSASSPLGKPLCLGFWVMPAPLDSSPVTQRSRRRGAACGWSIALAAVPSLPRPSLRPCALGPQTSPPAPAPASHARVAGNLRSKRQGPATGEEKPAAVQEAVSCASGQPLP